jgi:hypothetical protein
VLGITWPVSAALDEVALERKLFTPPFTPDAARPQPEWARIHAELRAPGVTLLLLWEECRAGQPDGYGYSRLCDLARGSRGRLSPTMRQTHPAGERLVVDYAGQAAEVTDGATGVARQIVCDNLKSGVTAASRYEPGISRRVHSPAELNGALREAEHRPQRPAHAPPRHQPQRIVRGDRAPSSAADVRYAVCLRQMASLPCGPGLPRRGARSFLLGAVSPGARGRGADDRPDDRTVPQG